VISKFQRWWIAIVYVGITSITGAGFMADTAKYAESIVPVSAERASEFWDFGHILWRPLGRVLFHFTSPLLEHFAGPSPTAQVLFALIFISWIAGFFCVLLLWNLIHHLTNSTWTANGITVLFIVSHAFLNYVHAGTSYPLGLAFLLLAYNLVQRVNQSAQGKAQRTVGIIAAGIATSAAISMWFQFAWATPALLFFAMMPKLSSISKPQEESSQRSPLIVPQGVTLVISSLFSIGLIYAVVLISLGLTTPASIFDWVRSASHGTDNIRGVSRVIFGLSRSYIHMGEDGLLFKRFLLHDPYNHVSLLDLLRLSLWKLAFFYAGFIWIAWRLATNRDLRTALLFLILGCLPCFIFASLFDGSAIERYFPIYPALMIGLAFALTDYASRTSSAIGWKSSRILILFIVIVAVSNLTAISQPQIAEREEQFVVGLQRALLTLKPASLIVINDNNDIGSFKRDFPLNPINLTSAVTSYTLVDVGGARSAVWRELFADTVLKTWNKDGDVWLRSSLLLSKPLATSTWSEGSDYRAHWKDIHNFFLSYTINNNSQDSNGLVLFPRTGANETQLRTLLANVKAPLPMTN
jgi:hypothetical protein